MKAAPETILSRLESLETSDKSAERWLHRAWFLGQLAQIGLFLFVVGAFWQAYKNFTLNQPGMQGLSYGESPILFGIGGVGLLLWTVSALLKAVFTGRDLHDSKLEVLTKLLEYLRCDVARGKDVDLEASLGQPSFRVKSVTNLFALLGNLTVREGYIDRWFRLKLPLADGSRLAIQLTVLGKRNVKFKSNYKIQGNQHGFIKYGMPKAQAQIQILVKPPRGQNVDRDRLEEALGPPRKFDRANIKKLEIEPSKIKLVVQRKDMELDHILAPCLWLFRGLARAT